MFGFILMTIASASLVRAQDGDIISPDNKTQCISQMVEWCNGMQYPQQGVGMTMLSITFEDPTGYYRAFCVSDGEERTARETECRGSPARPTTPSPTKERL
uniref:U59-Sparatoxin-Hju1a_1 n=1 Tax=Heteropoda jugulans TaxID=1358901 RepID=A0A4Q8KCJ0_9ARAC